MTKLLRTFMPNFSKLRFIIFFSIGLLILNSCNGMPGADARKYPPNPKERVKKNLEEGRGFRLGDAIRGETGKGGDFMFASANELWRASLDTLDFMPLASVNYGGGIIITDWYSDNNSLNESVKISIRFLTNEVRADALDIKIFYKKCNQVASCKISQKTGSLSAELKKEILSKATIYKKQKKNKNFRAYEGTGGEGN
mgnify:CR=1 FL=1|tara:strand:+ start:209 stop:802 length:594 start_codon:yes stop_codon:yes gene_type:complete